MALKLGSFSVMEYLWETSEKTSNGKHIEYNKYDIELLWKMGFVDTNKYSLEKWQLAFEPYKQPDEIYLLDKTAFISFDKYRFKGEVHIPFDAMRINEGLYTDKGLNELIEASIVPSCSLPKEELDKFFENLKNEFRTSDDLIKIKKDAKLKIKTLINNNPSPLRNLELIFDQMIKTGESEKLTNEIKNSSNAFATAQAAIEVSSFSKDPANKSHAKALELKNLVKSKSPKNEKQKGTEVELKKIRRSRKGMRG